MKIAHASDTHGSPKTIALVEDMDCDLIILTGDILQNFGRDEYGIVPERERAYQKNWLLSVAPMWAKAFRGREVLTVRGNHDFISITESLKQAGHPSNRIHEITDTEPCVSICGVTFAGFSEIPYIIGEWVGETHDMNPVIERAMACNPDILVTHAPPAGIFDKTFTGSGYGIVPLTKWLAYKQHKIKAHFFGHAHMSGGCSGEQMGIKFFNGALYLDVHSIDI